MQLCQLGQTHAKRFEIHILRVGLRKVAGQGFPGRFAKPCGLRAVRVRIPCLPLDDKSLISASMVKWKSCSASNGLHGVKRRRPSAAKPIRPNCGQTARHSCGFASWKFWRGLHRPASSISSLVTMAWPTKWPTCCDRFTRQQYELPVD